MSGHTPGPWRSGIGSRHRKRIDVRGGDLYPGAAAPPIVASIPREHDRDTCHANARLIAAAPEMLDALRQIAACFDPQGEWRDDAPMDIMSVGDVARAAIAKAVKP